MYNCTRACKNTRRCLRWDITYLPPCLEHIPVLPGFIFATSASSQMQVKQQKKERFERNRTWRSHVDVTYTLKRSRPSGHACTATAPLPVHRACGICYLCVRMCTGVAKNPPRVAACTVWIARAQLRVELAPGWNEGGFAKDECESRLGWTQGWKIKFQPGAGMESAPGWNIPGLRACSVKSPIQVMIGP